VTKEVKIYDKLLRGSSRHAAYAQAH
jgi:hypothetical protein